MKELFDKFLMYFCFGGIATIAVVAFIRATLPTAAQKVRFAAAKARMHGVVATIAITIFVCGMIVYGSTKNSTQSRRGAEGEMLVGNGAGFTASDGERGVEVGELMDESSSRDIRETSLQSPGLCASASLRETNALVRVGKWWRRGALDDGYILRFDDDWCFPCGTNHLSRVEVWASGAVFASEKASSPIAELATKLSVAPLDTEVFVGRTTNNTYRIEWHNGHPNRDANQTADASIELFRNGNIIVTEGDTITEIPYDPPFEHIGYGQNDDWVRAYFANADEILSVGYTNWVAHTIADNAPNGFFCLNVTLPHDPPEIIQLSVGDKVIAVNTAGTYSFVLPKGERHEIEMSFVPDGIDFTYYDAYSEVVSATRLTRASLRTTSGQNIHTEITATGSSEDIEIDLPDARHSSGHIAWYPFLSIAPDHEIDPSFPILFCAFVDLPIGEFPSVRWTSNDGYISETGEWLYYDDSASQREISVTATYKGIELHGHISIRQIIDETRIILSSPSVIVVEDPYTNRPNEYVVRTSDTVKMTASWELAQAGQLRLESTGQMPTRVYVGDEQNEISSFPYDIGNFNAHENGSLDFYLSSTNMNATGNVGSYCLKFIPDEGTTAESSADVRIVKIKVEAEANWPSNKVRHVFGPKELVHVRVVNSPSSISLTGMLPNHGQILSSSNDFIVPDQPGEFSVHGTADGSAFTIDCECIRPSHLRGDSPRSLASNEWLQLGIYPFSNGEAGVIAHIDTYLEPDYVSFINLRLFEGEVPPSNRQGWCLDTNRFPDSAIGHSTGAGASIDPATDFFTIGDMNKTSGGDYIGAWIGSANTYSNGSYRLDIPVSWYTVGCSVTNRLPDSVQTIRIYENGSMRVNKNGVSWQRDINGLEYQP